MKKILIAGGSGFLGKSILNSNIFKKYNLIAPSSKKLDLKDKDSVDIFFRKHKFDWIINCAVKGGRRTEPDIQSHYFDNINILSNLLNHVHEKCKLITFSSGAELYKKETFYGLSKIKCTEQVKNNPNVKNIRIYNIFGRYGMKDSFIFNSIRLALDNKNIEIWEDKLFDTYPVDNLIKIINSLIIEDENIYEEFDVVYNKKYRLSYLAKLIIYIVNSKSDIIIHNSNGSPYIGESSGRTDNLNIENLYSSLYNLIEMVRNEKI